MGFVITLSVEVQPYRYRKGFSERKAYGVGLMPLTSSVKNASAVLENPVGMLSLL